jgi:hypothetical protein
VVQIATEHDDDFVFNLLRVDGLRRGDQPVHQRFDCHYHDMCGESVCLYVGVLIEKQERGVDDRALHVVQVLEECWRAGRFFV